MPVTNDEIVVGLVIDEKGVVNGVRGADGAIHRLDKTTNRATKGSLKRFTAWAKGFIALALASVITRIGRSVTRLASDMQETQSKFNTVFESMAGKVEEFGRRNAHTMGLTMNEFRNLASNAGAILDGVGLDIEGVADRTTEIVALAADLASFHNTTIDEAFTAIRSGLVGETEPLKRYGIILRAEMVEGSNDAERAVDRLRIITEGAGKAVGDLGRTAESATNKKRKMVAIIKEARDAFANQLLGAIENVQGALSDTIGDGEGLINVFKEIGKQTGILITSLISLLGTLTGVTGASKAASGSVSGLGLAIKFANAFVVSFHTGLLVIKLAAQGLAFAALEAARGVVALGVAYENSPLGRGPGGATNTFNRITGALENLKDGMGDTTSRMAELSNGLFETQGAGDDADGALEGLLESLQNLGSTSGPTAGATGTVDQFKTSLQIAAEEAAKLDRRLQDLEATAESPALRDRYTQILRENAAVQDQIDLLGRMFDIQAGIDVDAIEPRALEIDSPEGQLVRFRVDQAAQAMLEEETRRMILDMEIEPISVDVDLPEDEMIQGLDRVSAHIMQVSGWIGQAFEDMSGAVGGSFEFVAGALTEFTNEAGEKSKAAFVAQKALNIADAVASTYVAANKALASAPPPFNFGLAAAVIGVGLANVARIVKSGPAGGDRGAVGAADTSITPQHQVHVAGARAGGGPVSGGRAYLVGEEGPEIIVPKNDGIVFNNAASQRALGMNSVDAGVMALLAREIQTLNQNGVKVSGTLTGEYETLTGVLSTGDANRKATGVTRAPRRAASVS